MIIIFLKKSVRTSAHWWWYSLLLISIPSYQNYAKDPSIFEEPTEELVTDRSTFFITPKEVRYNHRTYHHINRSVTKMDHFTVIEQHHYNMQNLGNHLTATQHILYTLPPNIGATYGFSAYDVFFKNPQDIRYYYMPTSRAYASFKITLANLGSFNLASHYNQRLFNNWHIGVALRSAMTENEWPQTQDQKIACAYPHFDIYTHFKSQDEYYHLFTSFSTMKYVTAETGGVTTTNENKIKFKYESQPHERYQSTLPFLKEEYMQNRIIPDQTRINNKDLRRYFYLYHHYECNASIQLYHELCYKHKKNILDTASINDCVAFIADSNLEPIPSTENSKENNHIMMQTLGNETGLKGDIEWLQLFYAIYYRNEHSNLHYNFPHLHTTLQPNKKENEHYIGCNSRWYFTKSHFHKFTVNGEYLFPDTKAHYYKFNIAYQNSFCTLSYHAMQYKVPYLVQYGYSQYRPWNYSHFKAPSAHKISLALHHDFPFVHIHPFLEIHKLHHHIYYKQVVKKETDIEKAYDHCIAQPRQLQQPAQLLSWGGHVNFCFFSCLHFDHTFTFYNGLGKQGNHFFKGYIPPYMYTGRYYFADKPYHQKMDIETGINVHFKDLYYADGYDIIAQQFYRQHQFATQGHPIVDLFLNFRIHHLKFSIKYSYVNGFIGKKNVFRYAILPWTKNSSGYWYTVGLF